MKLFEITLTWHQCELMAKYYSFPVAVFMLSQEDMQKQMDGKERKDEIHRELASIKKLRKEIREVFE